MVPMVLNPNGIEPTFFKKISFMHTKNINAVFKNGFNPVLGSIPRLPVKIYYLHLASTAATLEVSSAWIKRKKDSPCRNSIG